MFLSRAGLPKIQLHFGQSLSHFWSNIRLPYPQSKRIPRAFIWTQMLENILSNKRARAWGNLSVRRSSYFQISLIVLCHNWLPYKQYLINPSELNRSTLDRKSLKLIMWCSWISKMMTMKHRNSKTLHKEHDTIATVSDMPICLSGPGRRFLK